MGKDSDVEKTNAGVKKKGSWKQIAEFGQRVEEVIENSASEKAMERFDDWRPKVEESEKDVKKKTVDEAKLKENKLEKESKGVTEDLKEASEKAAEAGEKAVNRENPEEEVIKASEDVAKPLYSPMAKVFRRLEEMIYSKIVLRSNPYYLDTDDFSVDMKHLRKGRFEMDLNVPEEELRSKVKQKFGEEKAE